MVKHLPQPEVESSPALNPASDRERVEGPGQTSGATGTTRQENSARNGRADPFLSRPNRFPIQIFNDETRLQKAGHWGPIVMGAASFVLSLVIYLNTQELQDIQVRLQQEQVAAELADMRFKFLSELSVTDEVKKTSAEIGLAGHGMEKAFPVVHLALGVEPGHIRQSAVNVVYRLFQAETNEGREQLLGRLKDEFKFPNKTLHIGIVQSFVKIEPLLSPSQRTEVISFLQRNVVPVEACSYSEGRAMALEAAQFMGSTRADGIPYLVATVNVVRCGNAWLQAIINLENMAPQLSAQKRLELREEIGRVKQEVLDCLPQNISEPELAMGIGFSRFLESPKVVIEFEDFRSRLEKEFDRLLIELDKPS